MNLASKSKIARLVGISALGYMVANAVVALLWRRIFLSDLYASAGFYDITEPTRALALHGLSFYFLTGVVLSILFVHMSLAKDDGATASPARFAIVTGVLYWLIHDYSYIGRKEVADVGLYLGLEAVLVTLTFVLFAFILRLIFKKRRSAW